MKIQDQKQKSRLLRDTGEIKQHYKMYKTTKGWLFAGIALLTFGTGVTFGSYTVQADANTPSVESESSVEANNISSSSAVSSAANASVTSTSATSTSESSASNASSSTGASSEQASSENSESSSSETSSAASSASSSVSSNSTSSVASSVANVNAAKSSGTAVASGANTTPKKLDRAADLKASTATVTLTNGDATSTTVNSVGYGSKGDLHVHFSFVGKVGDVFTITIPANTSAYSLGNIEAMPSTMGTTTTVKNGDGSTTIIDTLMATNTSTYDQDIVLDQINNYQGQATPMPDIGTTTKTITYTINSAVQTPVTFTQTITPKATPSTPNRIYPSTNTGGVLPNIDYVYNFRVNESDGVLNDSETSALVNSAANYGGTTITIPVPSSFLLNSSLTNQLNGITDGTTITQTKIGADVVISVPAGKGNQNYQGGTGYKIAGSYKAAQQSAEYNVTAAGPATMTQIVNAAGDKITAKASGTWSETILGQGDPGNTSVIVAAHGNSNTDPSKLLLDTDTSDDPAYLNAFYLSVSDAATITNAKITINIPDGLDVIGIKVPTYGATTTSYLPGTTTYTYVLTLANGIVETGTVTGGGTVEPNDKSAIRTLVLSPNFLAAGASTFKMPTDSNPAINNMERFTVYGTLSSTYDNGNLVKSGDTLTSIMTVNYVNTAGEVVRGSNSSTQTVIFPEDTIAKVNSFYYQADYKAGTINAGYISLSSSGSAGQTTDQVYEPIYYFVLPKATAVTSVTNIPDGGVLSEYLADDGRFVVKIDYTGSGAYVSTQETGLIKISLANTDDAMPGLYPFQVYVTSPLTQLKNTTKVTDTSYTDGDANAVLVSEIYGVTNWKISSVSTIYGTSLAQGNQDLIAIKDGVSFVNDDDQTLYFYDSVLNIRDTDATNVESLVNLPTVGDSQGSEYTFELGGPITLPSSYTGKATVLYSTSSQTPPTGTNDRPDTTGYVTADQITDWSTVRSIIIQFDSIASNTSTGRIVLTGTAKDFTEQAGKTGYLETAFYGDGFEPSVSGKGEAAQISILNPPAIIPDDSTFEYDGTTKASEANNVTSVTVKVVLADGTSQELTLSSGDFTVTDDGLSANTYTYSLTTAGLAKVQAIIGTATLTNPEKTGTITITPKETTIGLGTVKFPYDGKTTASKVPGLTATVTVVTADGKTKVVELDSDDVLVAGDNTVVDDYTYTLTDNGLEKVRKAVGSNYKVSDTDITGSITIYANDTDVTLSNVRFTYDSKTKASEASGLIATVTLLDGSSKTIVLTSTDIDIVGADSTNVGGYDYVLNAAGLAKLQAAVGENYSVNGADASGKITISPATLTVELNNSGFKYDGVTKASQAENLQASLTLLDGTRVVVDLTSDDIFVVNDSVKGGDYKYYLSGDNVVNKLAQDNYNISFVASGEPVTGKIVIYSPPAIVIKGDNITYDGVTKASDATGLTVDVTFSDGSTKTVVLSSDDIAVEKDSTTVGDYTFALSASGLARLQSLQDTISAGHSITNPDETATITIVPADITISLNAPSFTYDGATKASETNGENGVVATVILTDGSTTKVNLTSDDFEVTSDAADANVYSYVLNKIGLAKVQAVVGNNYVVSDNNVASTITITPAEVTITAPTVSKDYDGNSYTGAVGAIIAGKPANGADLQYSLTDISDDVNRGVYPITVNAGKNPNYIVTIKAGSLTITAAKTTVDLNVSSFTYNGKTTASASDKLTATVTLADGTKTTVGLTAADVTVAKDSVNAGDYTFTLSAAGLEKVQSAIGNNYAVNADNATGKVTIDKATVTITAPTLSKNYDGKPYTGDTSATVSNKPVAGDDLQYSLTDISGDVDQGTYPITVTATETDNPNYEVTVINGSLTINASKTAVVLNPGGFIYNGTTKASGSDNLTATVTTLTGDKIQVDLTTDDFTVTKDDIQSGDYSYALTAEGLAKIQKATGNNYTVNDKDVTGKITIKRSATIATVNNQSFTYDGITKASDAKGLLASVKLADGSYNTVELTQDDITVMNDGVDKNIYTYTLSATGLVKIQTAVGDNYTVSDTDVTGTITIKAANLKVELNNDGFAYDGSTKASEDNGLVAKVTLKDGSVKEIKLTSADINVPNDSAKGGEYTYTLSDAGLAKVQAIAGNNYTVNADDAIGNIVIVSPPAIILGHDSFTYNGKTKASDADELSVVLVMSDGSRQTLALTSSDITVTRDSTEVGTYTYGLSKAGLKRLQAIVGTEHAITNPEETAQITITPAETKADLNNVHFSYDGKTKASQASDLTATVGGKVVKLTSEDITVTNDSINANDYQYRLNATGLAKVQAIIGDNYTVNANNVTGTITITPVSANVTFKFVDEQGNVIKANQIVNGNVGDAYSLTAPNIPGYAFASSDQPLNGKITGDKTITLVYKSGTVATETPAKVTFKFVDENGNTIKSDQVLNGYVGNAYDLTAPDIDGYAFESSDEPLNGKITGDETITLVYKNGTVATETPAKVTFKFVDENGNTIKSDQVLNGYVGNAYDLTAPTIAGYAFASSDEPLNGKITGDNTITLVYKHGEVATETPAKVTFKFVDENGNTIKSDQVLNGYVGNAYDMTAPTISGYTFLNADGLLSGTITGNATITLIYKSKTSLPNGGGNGGDGTGTTPGKTPDNSGDNGSTNTVSGHKSNGSVEKTSFSTNATAQPQTRAVRYQTKGQAKRLPQTGDSQGNPLVIIGMSLMATLFGLFGIKRKKHEQD